MRRLVGLSLLIGLLLSCDLQYGDTYYPEDDARIPAYFSDLHDIEDWVTAYVDGTTDMEQFGVRENWQTPLETLDSAKGDCEDQALLFMYVAKLRLDAEPSLVAIHCEWEDAARNHALASYDGIFYDPTGVIYELDEWEVFARLSYNDAMDLARRK